MPTVQELYELWADEAELDEALGPREGDLVADLGAHRDVLVHVDAQRGLAECARVLRPDGADLVWGIYQLLGKTCPTVYVCSKAS